MNIQFFFIMKQISNQLIVKSFKPVQDKDQPTLTRHPVNLFRDDEIKTLNFMIGPQLYMGDWKTFVDDGYLANPKCI